MDSAWIFRVINYGIDTMQPVIVPDRIKKENFKI